MSEIEYLQAQIQRVRIALGVKNCFEAILRYGFYGICGSAIILVLSKFIQFTSFFWVIPFAIGILFGLITGFRTSPTLRQTTLFLDYVLSLQNRLSTLLDYTGRTNRLYNLLLKDTTQLGDKLQPALAYQHLNLNYLFQFLLAGLVGIAIWVFPLEGALKSEKERLHRIRDESAQKLRNTVTTLSQSGQLDDITRIYINEMERLYREIESGQISLEEILSREEKLSRQIRNYFTYKEVGENLYKNISLLLGKEPSNEDILANPQEVQKTLQELKIALERGTLSINMLDQLKEILKNTLSNLSTVEDDNNLKNYLREALNSDNISEPLTEFFEKLAQINWAFLEQIQTRFALTRKEITSELGKYYPEMSTPHKSAINGAVDGFSRANEKNFPPMHSASGPSTASTIYQIPPQVNPRKITQIQELIKKREAALLKPFWPSEYNEIIEKYFK